MKGGCNYWTTNQIGTKEKCYEECKSSHGVTAVNGGGHVSDVMSCKEGCKRGGK